jgi:hypothetical protein
MTEHVPSNDTSWQKRSTLWVLLPLGNFQKYFERHKYERNKSKSKWGGGEESWAMKVQRKSFSAEF